MSNSNPDGSPEHEWDERGELAWNEFDWERYLREQDEAIGRYLSHYEACRHSADRIDGYRCTGAFKGCSRFHLCQFSDDASEERRNQIHFGFKRCRHHGET